MQFISEKKLFYGFKPDNTDLVLEFEFISKETEFKN
jgi:hypothetical protein